MKFREWLYRVFAGDYDVVPESAPAPAPDGAGKPTCGSNCWHRGRAAATCDCSCAECRTPEAAPALVSAPVPESAPESAPALVSAPVPESAPESALSAGRTALWFKHLAPIAPGDTALIEVPTKVAVVGGAFVVDSAIAASFLVQLRVERGLFVRRCQLGSVPASRYTHGARLPFGVVIAPAVFVAQVQNIGRDPVPFVGVLLTHCPAEISLAAVMEARAQEKTHATCPQCDGAGLVVVPKPAAPEALAWPDDVTAPVGACGGDAPPDQAADQRTE